MSEQEVEAEGRAEVSSGKREVTPEGLYVTPAIDIYQTPTELVLVVDLPGVESENVEIDLNHNIISILGKVSEQADGQLLTEEYRVADFFRSFGITELVDYTRVQAFLEDGVLRVVFPKAHKALSRKISISCE